MSMSALNIYVFVLRYMDTEGRNIPTDNCKLSELRVAQRRIIVIIKGIWRPEGIHSPPHPHPLISHLHESDSFGQ